MNCYHVLLELVLLFSAVMTTLAYSPSPTPTPPQARWHETSSTSSSLHMTSSSSSSDEHHTSKPGSLQSRRNMMIQSGIVGASLLYSRPSAAKKPPPEPLTKENVDAAWNAIQYEVDNPNGGVATMQRYIDNQDFEGLLDFTKTYDLQVRKLKWGRCKSFLTNNAEKEVATLLGNALTFDLIGINRSSRAGQENATQANKYLQELRTDLGKMMQLKSTIQLDGDSNAGFNAYYNEIKGN